MSWGKNDRYNYRTWAFARVVQPFLGNVNTKIAWCRNSRCKWRMRICHPVIEVIVSMRIRKYLKKPSISRFTMSVNSRFSPTGCLSILLLVATSKQPWSSWERTVAKVRLANNIMGPPAVATSWQRKQALSVLRQMRHEHRNRKEIEYEDNTANTPNSTSSYLFWSLWLHKDIFPGPPGRDCILKPPWPLSKLSNAHLA